MGSEKRSTQAAGRRRSRAARARHCPRVCQAARQFPRARYSEVRADTAAVRPAAVSDMRTE